MIEQLHLGLSNLCNLKCKHCFVVDKSISNIDVVKLKQFLDCLEKHGLRTIYYTYGEPLLASNIFEIIEYVKKLGIFQTLLTNGTMIDQEKALLIKNSGINRVMVSIDSSNPRIHDENRGVRNSFKKACEGIKLLKKYRCNVGIATTYLDANETYLKNIIKLADKLGVDYISFLAERRDGKVNIPLSDEYISIFRDAVINKKNYIFHDNRLVRELDEMLKDGIIDEDVYSLRKDQNQCCIHSNLSLAPNGNVYKCNFINRKPIININDVDDFESLVNYLKGLKIQGCEFYERKI